MWPPTVSFRSIIPKTTICCYQLLHFYLFIIKSYTDALSVAISSEWLLLPEIDLFWLHLCVKFLVHYFRTPSYSHNLSMTLSCDCLYLCLRMISFAHNPHKLHTTETIMLNRLNGLPHQQCQDFCQYATADSVLTWPSSAAMASDQRQQQRWPHYSHQSMSNHIRTPSKQQLQANCYEVNQDDKSKIITVTITI